MNNPPYINPADVAALVHKKKHAKVYIRGCSRPIRVSPAVGEEVAAAVELVNETRRAPVERPQPVTRSIDTAPVAVGRLGHTPAPAEVLGFLSQVLQDPARSLSFQKKQDGTGEYNAVVNEAGAVTTLPAGWFRAMWNDPNRWFAGHKNTNEFIPTGLTSYARKLRDDLEGQETVRKTRRIPVRKV